MSVEPVNPTFPVVHHWAGGRAASASRCHPEPPLSDQLRHRHWAILRSQASGQPQAATTGHPWDSHTTQA